jgi:hypothetical protein
MWPINLSVRLSIIGLVGRYLTNYLMDRDPVLHRRSFPTPLMREERSIRY